MLGTERLNSLGKPLQCLLRLGMVGMLAQGFAQPAAGLVDPTQNAQVFGQFNALLRIRWLPGFGICMNHAAQILLHRFLMCVQLPKQLLMFLRSTAVV